MDFENKSSINTGRYNIITVVTFDYFPFFLVFLNSLFRNTEHDKIETIYVVIDQFPQEFIDYLSQFAKIRIIADSSRLTFSGTHGENWRKAVGKKLIACHAILQESDLPLLLIDSDTLFIKDVSDYFYTNHDILVTFMARDEERHVRRDGLKINFIGSAVIFNRRHPSLQFIERWLQLIDYVSTNYAPPHETPALNLLLDQELAKGTLAIGVINDQYICADQNIYEGTRVIHLKTWGPSTVGPIENFMLRVSRQQWPAQYTPVNYLDALCYERWLMYQLGYF